MRKAKMPLASDGFGTPLVRPHGTEQVAKTPYGQDAKIARKGYYFLSS